MFRSFILAGLCSSLALLSPLTLATEPLLPPQDRPEAFRRLDVDADGWISREEAQAHPEVSANFANVDADNDGRLTLSEFEKVPLNRSDQPGQFQTPERG